MKEKILQALKTKFKNLGFGDTTFDAVASFLEATVTEETQIDNSVAGVEGLLKGFQADADKRVTTAVQKIKTETPPKAAEPTPVVPPTAKKKIKIVRKKLSKATCNGNGKRGADPVTIEQIIEHFKLK